MAAAIFRGRGWFVAGPSPAAREVGRKSPVVML